MRVPEPKIRAAILHTEEEIRVTAVGYFSGSFSRDETIVPLVIQAVQRYGRDKAFRVLRSAQNLPQTRATMGWLVDELRREYDPADLDEDNYRFAVALMLYRAQPQLLLEVQPVIATLAGFPAQLRPALQERLDMQSWDWDRGWAALESLGRRTARRGAPTSKDLRRARRIVESLALHREAKGATVVDMLEQRQRGESDPLMAWLAPLVTHLAGAMRLEPAIPVLVRQLYEDEVGMIDESITALIKIGTDEVVRAIAQQWPNATSDFRRTAADVLDHIHTDFCAEQCLAFFEREADAQTRLSLAHAVASQLVEEGIEPLRQLVLGRDDTLSPDERDLRYRLVVVAMIAEATFPELDAWHQEAVANGWGLGDYRPGRLADSFDLDRLWLRHPGNGKPRGHL